MKRYYIYKITLLKGSLAGKYYIGKHKMKKDRKYPLTDGYYGSGKILKDYYKKYGVKDSLVKEILEFNDTEEENREREKYYIGDKYETDPNCLNLKEGGQGGQYSQEVKDKISKALKGYKHSEESRRHMSEGHKGHIAWNKGRKASEEEVQKNREGHLGKKHSQEWKDNMSQIMKEKGPAYQMTEEIKQKISQTLKGRPRSIEARKKQNETLKKKYAA